MLFRSLDLGRDRKRNDAERWILADGTKVLGESTPQFSHYMELFPNQNRGFGLIEKRSKILDTDYIVRIQLKAIEKGISAVSYPVYQCIKSREHRTILGLSFRPGYRVGALSGIDSDGYMGIDLFMGYTFRLTGLFFLPGFTIGGVLGYSWTGTSTDQFALLNYNVIEFRPHLDIELVRLPIRNGVSCSIGAIVDIGIGANLYSYHGHIDRSDWGAVSMIGGGGRLSIRGPSVLQIGVSAIVQNRMQRITIDGALPSDPIIATDVKIVWLVWELMFRIKR